MDGRGIFLIFMSIALIGKSQQLDEQAIEYWVESGRLTALLENPDAGKKKLNINNTNRSELRALEIFEEAEIDSILGFISKNKPLYSVYQLQMLPSVDLSKLSRALPYLTTEALISTKENVRSELILKEVLQQKSGEFKGLSSRLRFRGRGLGHSSIGFLLDQDGGEKLTWQPEKKQFGVDHFSGFLKKEFRRNSGSVIVGDFSLNTGEGLVFGSGLGLFKGAESIFSIKNRSTGLRPVASSAEYGFLRGFGGEFTWTGLSCTSFISHTVHDATLRELSDGSKTFSSFNESGMHRTEGELLNKWSVHKTALGMNLEKIFRKALWGVNWVGWRFSETFTPSDELRNVNWAQGKDFWNLSGYSQIYLQNKLLFSEYAASVGSFAWLLGAMIPLNKYSDISILYRDIGSGYFPFSAQYFAEKSDGRNEKGFYIGWKWKKKQWMINAFMDFYEFPWLRYRIDFPSWGNECLFSISYIISKMGKIDFRLSRKNNLLADSDRETLFTIRSNWKGKLNVEYKLMSWLLFRSRLQGNLIAVKQAQISKGVLLSTELIADYQDFQIAARVMSFDTDGFDNREYIYEKDMLYAFSVPFFQNEGMRFYLYVKNKFGKHLSAWAKVGQTVYTGQLGKDGKFMKENKNLELKIQLGLKF